MNRNTLALGGVALLLVVAVAAMWATQSPSPFATAPSATASPTVAAAKTTPTASASLTVAPPGVYMSKALGFALDVPTPWHQAICGNSDPVGTRLPAIEQFTSAPPMDEFIGDVGSPNDRVSVSVEDNPQRLSATDFAAVGDPYAALGKPRSVTFAGRAAAEVGDPGGEAVTYYVADADRMYLVYYNSLRNSSEAPADRPMMLRIVRSFRLLTAAERQALPDPKPILAAAPTTQALASTLATAFEKKDVAALEPLLSPCVSQTRQQAGGSLITRQRFVAGLRTQFANGLTVTVDTSAIRSDPLGSGDTLVGSRWNATPPGDLRPPVVPGQEAKSIDLMLGRTLGGLYWRGAFLPLG